VTSSGTWFAYCERSRVLPLDQLAQRLSAVTGHAARLDQSNLLVIAVHDSMTGNDADVSVTLDIGSHVRAETAELADDLVAGKHNIDPGVPVPDAEALRSADARYELTWDLRFSDEVYNTLIVLAELLIEECRAIVYDATHRRFV
jgi:hypothetical protein